MRYRPLPQGLEARPGWEVLEHPPSDTEEPGGSGVRIRVDMFSRYNPL
jgi:hypothetical protein